MTSTQKLQVINAPSEEPIRGLKTVFLAGTTTTTTAVSSSGGGGGGGGGNNNNNNNMDWRAQLSASLGAHPITIFNPHRADWDSTWREDIAFDPYREQVLWELDKQVQADLVVVYFHPATVAPISLLEFGLSARVPGKVVAVAPVGYAKRGNVQVVCQKFGIEFLEDIDEVHEVIVRKLSLDC